MMQAILPQLMRENHCCQFNIIFEVGIEEIHFCRE
uniref:Uncharacterized protein n=1 Tax=Arundo donax TaxID=35708 RepID=A0A0A9ET92_ARUDO